MMSAPELTPMVLSLALALLSLTGTTDGAITCEAVTTRYESTVTCFFGTDIFDSKHNFNLQFYYPNLSADPETPLKCNWVTSEDLNCKKSQGVVYDRVLGDQMTVKGPADPRRVGGKYVCQLVPKLDVAVRPCTLTFRDVTTTTTTTTTQPMTLVYPSAEDLTDKVTTTVILCGVVLTVALIILVAVLFIVCTRVKLAERIRKWRKRTKKEPDGKKPEETADAEEKGNLLEQTSLIAASNAEGMNEVKVQSRKEAGLLHMNVTPRPSNGQAFPPVNPRTEETQPAGKEGDKTPEPSRIEDVQPVVDETEETNPQPEKKRSWWQRKKSSSSSAPKARPGDQKSTGTGDPPEVTTGNKDRSSGKGKEKSRKSKEVKGEGEKELLVTEQAQQPASTVDGSEGPRRPQSRPVKENQVKTSQPKQQQRKSQPPYPDSHGKTAGRSEKE